MNIAVKSPRKLIEVALPLDSINAACVREKSIRHGHPSTLHLWWARRPLAAARATIFAQLVNDPGYQQGGGFKYGMNKKDAAIERKRLFSILEDLVIWENTTNQEVLERARLEILRSWREVCDLNKDHPESSTLFNPERLPSLHDPFAGGGAIPLEAQRLGLDVFATDLNPVAVLINKAMVEIAPKFAGGPPIGESLEEVHQLSNVAKKWDGTTGLAEDVRRYGTWLRAEAHKRIGHLYPPIEITAKMALERPDLKPLVGQKLTVIAWLWARTVKSPNPAFAHVAVPLASTFVLFSKEGKEAYVDPVIDGDKYRFTVKKGKPPSGAKNGTKLARGANFSCLISGVPIEPNYIKSESIAKRMGARLMAIVAEGSHGRVYLEPSAEHESIASTANPAWFPDGRLVEDARAFTPFLYGLSHWKDLFTSRQLVALTTFSDLISELRPKVFQDAIVGNQSNTEDKLDLGGTGARAYSEAVSVYLSLAISKIANIGSSIASWMSDRGAFRETFARPAIQMTWDFAEANPFADAGGSFSTAIEKVAMAIDAFPISKAGIAEQADASSQLITAGKIVSTDPPYYDNIPYADLSDFFYVWLRPSMKPVFPNLFATLAVPKAEELVACAYRHDGKIGAEKFFLEGMTGAMHRLAEQSHPAFPITIYYAFKQSETGITEGTASTGWETFLDAVIKAGFAISGTWPMRTEGSGRMRAMESNALASSVILVCRRRSVDAPSVSRREFLRELNAVLPDALDEMTKGSGGDISPVAAVDLSQSIIGPGMALFSKYASVIEADGAHMSVRTALQLINRFLAEDDFDHDTQFCLRWFEEYGWGEGKYGAAETLSRAHGTSVDGVRTAGVIESGHGVVRLLKWSEYAADWDPKTDTRNPVWETLHHLIRALKQSGETSAGSLLSAVKSKAEATRQLAYRLYTLCERQGWAEDARAYNELITSWAGIELAAAASPSEKQLTVFE